MSEARSIGTDATWCICADPENCTQKIPGKRCRKEFTPVGSGWQCPNCGSAHAPDVKTCPLPARLPSALLPMPFFPAQPPFNAAPPVTVDCGCPTHSGYVCMNAACPRAMRVTCVIPTTGGIPSG